MLAPEQHRSSGTWPARRGGRDAAAGAWSAGSCCCTRTIAYRGSLGWLLTLFYRLALLNNVHWVTATSASVCEACLCFGWFKTGTVRLNIYFQKQRSCCLHGLGFHLPIVVEYGWVACGRAARSRSRAPGRGQIQCLRRCQGKGRAHPVSRASATSRGSSLHLPIHFSLCAAVHCSPAVEQSECLKRSGFFLFAGCFF